MKLEELKQIIREALLNEVSYKEAQQSLDSKKFKKMIKRWHEPYEDLIGSEVDLEEYEEFVKNYVILPRFNGFDLTDNQKGLSLLWFLRYIRSTEIPATGGWVDIFGMPIPKHLDLNAFHDLRRNLETFFHYNRFMSERDLNKIASPDELESITLQAAEDIKRYQEKQAYGDAEQGTEVLMDNDQWYIAAIHNKGAACKFGKGTDWCTAAPGLDYFKAYYKEDDPLFYFYDKKNDKKYQFHYGTKQFMDSRDRPTESAGKLHALLRKTKALNKYKSFTNFYNRNSAWIIARDPEITLEEWQFIIDKISEWQDAYNNASASYDARMAILRKLRHTKQILNHNPTAQQYQLEWEDENIYS